MFEVDIKGEDCQLAAERDGADQEVYRAALNSGTSAFRETGSSFFVVLALQTDVAERP
ncbi:MAG: hypothetical protein R3F14_28125 [Polyangiaceae bacterium]